MKNYIQDGRILAVTAPAAVASGDFVQVGRIRGVAVTSAASGAQVELATEGVFEIPKTGSEEFATLGLPVYCVLSGNGVKTVTTASTTANVLVGVNVATSGAVTGSLRVKLHPTASNQTATAVT
jgi:predicted RecA/RadA family phage recombinase